MRAKFRFIYKFKVRKGLTLVELLLASSLFSVIILGVTALDFYYRSQEIGEEARLRAQREVSLVLTHMTRNLSLVMGSVALGGNNIGLEVDNPGKRLKARIDRNNNGVIDAADNVDWIGYRYVSGQYRVDFYPQHNAGAGWGGGPVEVISSKIKVFEINLQDNFIIVEIAAQDKPSPTITFENPEVRILTRIYMPGYSY